ncbi:helix-turn-helix domain-containing protein [Oceanobacter mangrovi]|uniref:helix-turn-helix domain-containing protein n=1 Tax=Oceanobacter mangrovi TaxID=2862510 RepID=UPI001C8EA72A|nr:helix-turn-helix domain-containing protein [Oceanobacter mangrovi]
MDKKSASAVIERLKRCLGAGSDSELSRITKVNRQTLSNWKTRNTVPYTLCIQAAEEQHFSLDWLLLGVGQPTSHALAEETASNCSSPPLTDKQQELLALFDNLSAVQQQDLLADVKEKSRISEMEKALEDLKAQMDSLKNLR